MKFQKKRAKRTPYYGKACREAMREQMYLELGKALAAGKTDAEMQRIVDAHSVSANPVK